ncbi:hypothetical protein IH879_14375 [candidate division KSB1 bacterium]|nr:hypothetical protein [candidate division KSB1 bacterium]
MKQFKFLIMIFMLVLLPGAGFNTMVTAQEIQSAAALGFSPDGVLFVGDNVGGAIYAFDMGKGTAPAKPAPVNVENIDARVASILGVGPGAIVINDMAVHPVTREIYLSVTRGYGSTAQPAIVKVDGNGNLTNIRLSEVKYTKQTLHDVPDGSKHFQARGMMEAPTAKDLVKAEAPMHTLAIMDIEYYKGEIFVAGISNEEFASTLRRIPYPFSGKYASSKIKMWHIAHDHYETRAPIRALVAKNFNGADYLIAAYTCSPVVLIPIKELKDGASVTGKTIGDMGNGQPLDMVLFNHPMMKKEYLFVTNNSRMPQVFPVDGLVDAKEYKPETLEPGMKMDAMGVFPYGPLGYMTMFVGSSLQIDLLNEMYFVSLTRDAQTGSLDLESLITMFPVKLHRLTAEYDFPGVAPPEM